MVARGGFGVEVVMLLCLGYFIAETYDTYVRRVRKNKLVNYDTQMMESMIFSPIPTRAEVSDVANAVH
jgi:pyruvate kinase